MNAEQQTFDGITAATKLRRDTVEVQSELEEKRAEYYRRMERVQEEEEKLKADRAKLQDTLVQYYKYIQDNELKRTRANRKAASEEKAKQERFGQIQQLKARMEELEEEKNFSRQNYQQYIKYQKYLEDVLQHNENEEYQDPRDIIKRYEILDDNTRVLQRRKTQLEEDLGKNKVQLLAKRARKKNESVDLQNQLSELQNNLETLQRDIKRRLDDLESMVTHKGGTTKTVGQVKMACQNLYDRCIEWNSAYRSRAHADNQETDVLHQLTIIGDCLSDYAFVIKRHQENMRAAALAQGGIAAAASANNGNNTSTVVAAGGGARGAAALNTTASGGLNATTQSNGNNKNIPRPPNKSAPASPSRK